MKNYGHIKNPLTIIAIFAGFAEVGGTSILPFLLPANQGTFMWFLIIFPFFLVGIFFLTLNFNNAVLYSPSDYRDDQAFLDSLSGMKTIKEGTKEISIKEPEKLIESAKNAAEHPKKAIINAWSEVENAVKESSGIDYNQPFELEHILKENFEIPKEKYKLFLALKEIRDKAIHAPYTTVSSGTAIDYSASALKLTEYLKDNKKKL